jgi:hypothetical protein
MPGPEDGLVLPDVGPRIGPAISGRIEPGTAQEVILDEPEVGVAAQRLMVDEAAAGARGDDDPGYTQAVAVAVNHRRRHMIVEATPVIPAQEDCRGVPHWALHRGVDQRRDVGLSLVRAPRRVLAISLRWHDPANRGQRTGLRSRQVVADRLNVAELIVLPDVAEQGQRIPYPRRGETLSDRRTSFCRVVPAVRLGAGCT